MANLLRLGGCEEKEVAAAGGLQVGELAAVDGVGAGDDTAAGGLAEDFGQLHARHDGAGDEVVEHHAGAHRGELVGIAHNEQVRAFREGGEEVRHEGRVDHGSLIDDEEIAHERLATMATPFALALVLEQAVQGLRFQPGAFIETFGGAAGGRGQHELHLLALQDEEDAAQDGGLAHAGAAGDDEQAMAQGLAHGALLALGQLLAGVLHHPGQRRVLIDGGIGGGQWRKRLHAGGDVLLCGAQIRQIDELALALDLSRCQQGLNLRGNEGIGSAQQFTGFLDGFCLGEAAVAAAGSRLQHMQHAGANALWRVVCHAEVGGDVVRRFEADAADVLRQAIRVLLQHCLGVITIGLVDAQGARGTDAMLVQKEHDAVDGLLLHPGLANLEAALLAHAFHILELFRLVFDDVEDLGAELLNDALRVGRADAIDEAAAEIALDAVEGIRPAQLQVVRLELRAEVPVRLPRAACLELLAGHHTRGLADEAHDIALALRNDLQDAVAVVLIVKHHTLHLPAQDGGVVAAVARGGHTRRLALPFLHARRTGRIQSSGAHRRQRSSMPACASFTPMSAASCHSCRLSPCRVFLARRKQGTS